MPDGRWLNQLWPKSVMKVISGANSEDKEICQKPEFMSSLENT